MLIAAGSAPFNGGYAHARPRRSSRCHYNGTAVLARRAAQRRAATSTAPICTIELDLGLGDGHAGYLTSDLSYDYVRINAEYRT